MEYAHLLATVRSLDFIHDDVTADAAIKAVLGIMFSRMDELQARRLSEYLPEPLTFQLLRGHQRRPIGISPGYYKAELCIQFNLSEDQSEQLIHTVCHALRSGLPQESLALWDSGLPEEWIAMVHES